MQTVLTRKAPTSGRFSALMDLYEENYMMIRVLAPQLRSMVGVSSCPDDNDGLLEQAVVYVSRVEGCLDLELSQIEHNKYTTTFNLTYRFTHDHRRPREPDMMIRLYHDARSCEVMSGLLQGLKHGPIRRRDLDEGYRLNRFLYKWMRYCLKPVSYTHLTLPTICSV